MKEPQLSELVIVPDDEDLLDDDFENDDQIILVPLGRIKKLLNNMVLESKWIMGFPEWMEGLTKNHISMEDRSYGHSHARTWKFGHCLHRKYKNITQQIIHIRS